MFFNLVLINKSIDKKTLLEQFFPLLISINSNLIDVLFLCSIFKKTGKRIFKKNVLSTKI